MKTAIAWLLYGFIVTGLYQLMGYEIHFPTFVATFIICVSPGIWGVYKAHQS